jgi:cysteinyl-tRNA synthetase
MKKWRESLKIYNSLSGDKQHFKPIVDDFVGMYVCGPTLYSEPHMGNMRTFMNFDMVYRYFLFLGFKVKYVRNITDAGHITNSLGLETDSIGLAAKMEQVQPLEIVYKYNTKFQELQRIYNFLPPTIEPTATAHIQEQIEVIEKIIENGFAYSVNGSVYFDVRKYSEKFNYGILSGRKVEELAEETRKLIAQDEKQFFADFALWKKANPDDMQIWRSPWGNGNPGWHIECTAMSTKYLGKKFDIHGGGMDLKFPHHEDEIAQSCGSFGCEPCNYWMHANMLNVNGQKMSKSMGNFFLPKEIVEGSSPIFNRPFSSSVVRFFMMQAHYRSSLDITQTALEASEKGFQRIASAVELIPHLKESAQSTFDVNALVDSFFEAMNDDFNTPVLIANLFEATKRINAVYEGKEQISSKDLKIFQSMYLGFIQDVLGLTFESKQNKSEHLERVMELVIELRAQVRAEKNWTLADNIRLGLSNAGITVKDGKDGASWEVNR